MHRLPHRAIGGDDGIEESVPVVDCRLTHHAPEEISRRPSESRVSAKAMNPRCISCVGTAVAMRLMQAVVKIAPPAGNRVPRSSIDSLSCETSPGSKRYVIQLQPSHGREEERPGGFRSGRDTKP